MKFPSLSLILSGLLALGVAGPASAASDVAVGKLLLEETFPNDSNGRANLCVGDLGWRAYGGAHGEELSFATGPALQSVLVSAGKGSPSQENGFLAFLLARDRPSFPEYAVVRTGIEIADPGVFEWRMNCAVNGTFRVRVLVQVEGRWYASDVSDTNREYFEPATQGSSADFASAYPETLTKQLVFNRDALDWRVFVLEPGGEMKLGDTSPRDLPEAPITGIGFHVMGGNTGRIDTLRVHARAAAR